MALEDCLVGDNTSSEIIQEDVIPALVAQQFERSHTAKERSADALCKIGSMGFQMKFCSLEYLTLHSYYAQAKSSLHICH